MRGGCMVDKRILHILWTNADLSTAQQMVLMYATNSLLQSWWDEVTVIIWGAAAKLVAEDSLIQESIQVAQNLGVKFSACVACAHQLGVVEQLRKLGIEVKPWGEPLTEILQKQGNLLTV